MPLSKGDHLGPYEIIAPIGAGGMGEVYKARDTRLDRVVAVKVSKDQFTERFTREAKASAALNHPNICCLHDVGPNYLVMEFIDGIPLAGPMPVEKALEYARQILDALEEAHSKGVTHRDLKPGNILVAKQGIKLLDFGLAKMENPSRSDGETATISQIGAVMGTPAYMAPEQWAGQPADARSDLYAFGCVLYEMLTGKHIWQHGVPQPRTPVEPAALEAVLKKCLAVDPVDRWQSAAAVRSALSAKPSAFRKYVLAAVAALVLIAGVAIFWPRAGAAPLTDKDVLVLADFTNTTGDSVFDLTLREALAIQLEASPFLKIMEDERVRETLRLMGRPPGERITNDTAREVCIRTSEKAMIGGSVAGLGNHFAISLQATDCQSGAILAREQAEAEDKEHVLKALAQASIGMRRKLGEALGSIQKPDLSLDLVMTPSLEALQAYSRGLAQARQGADTASIPFFQRATDLDPNFATAYRALFQRYTLLNARERSLESLRKAFALRDHATEPERLMISGLYFQRVTGELNKAVDVYQLLAQSYPRDSASHNQLGTIYSSTGEYEKAIQEYRQTIRLTPSTTVAYSNLMGVYSALDRFEEAKAVAQEFIAHKLEAGSFHLALLRLAHIQSDRAAAEQQIQWFAGKPGEYQSLNLQGANAAVLGRRSNARELRQRAADVARRQGYSDIAAVLMTQGAIEDPVFGNCEPGRGPQRPPLTLALCGDTAAAQKLIESADNPNRGPILYLRGLNLLHAKKGAEAAAEFQKLLDHKGANWGPYYPVSYVGLARAAALAGDAPRAKLAYEDFLALWKDADPDIPVLIQAKKEYAALQ